MGSSGLGGAAAWDLLLDLWLHHRCLCPFPALPQSGGCADPSSACFRPFGFTGTRSAWEACRVPPAQWMSDESAVETLTVQLAGLELTITARRLPGGDSGSASSTSFELVSSGAAQAETSVIDPADGFSLEWIERQALAATTAQQCADFARLLPFLDPLVAKLSASAGEWTPAARIGRAYRAGVLAGLRLSGRTSELDSLSVPFRNIYYVVLRGTPGVQPCWTNNYQVYLRKVGRPGEKFHDLSISQALPSHAEASAFLSGAGQRWPPRAE